ncbi:MAG: bifunctional 2-C-methyl-D-erythritol 4-phosphate cytidylyltransferase/2-C-methyl-D-erythritol 2,4-cyclodiphosphate synthase [Pseudomonadota bacterium]
MSVGCIIVAAGRGTRAGSDIPKQYVEIGGKPILRRSLDAILASKEITSVQVVIHSEDGVRYEKAVKSVDDARLKAPVLGGESRTASVKAGLSTLDRSETDLVLIHDAARPFVTEDQLSAVILATRNTGAAVLAIPVVDALWRAESGLTPVDREHLWRAQTPQGFQLKALLDAYDAFTGDARDDVAIARAAGLDVLPVPGSETNFKITTPGDFARAERELMSEMDVRTGTAYDVHAFGPGQSVVLNGIHIDHDQAMIGHSDADVAMHAVTDAIFGALCEGDIGQWFPPTDAQWKGAASEIFLAKAVERATHRGFVITHIDSTIICETPKIGPHSMAMRENLARICQISMDRISVKATTSEQLGFTGRREGIAAIASATLVKS